MEQEYVPERERATTEDYEISALASGVKNPLIATGLWTISHLIFEKYLSLSGRVTIMVPKIAGEEPLG